MNFLIVGAGAIGGYFGGRLVEAGEEVTFLVRENRQKQLEQDGLVIRSIHGNFHSKVKTLTQHEERKTFDIILIALKAYQLEGTIELIADYMHEKTLILPLLNGYEHYQMFFDRYGKEKIVGGLCFIESTLDHGTIVHSSPRHDIVFGGWEGNEDNRIQKLYECFQQANCNTKISDQIEKDIWQKYIFIASMSGITTLFRSPIGPILENKQANRYYQSLIDEICSLAQKKVDGIPENMAEMIYTMTKSLTYTMKSSMQRDMEKGLPTEAEHLQGYLLKLADEEPYPTLATVYANLMIYGKNAATSSMLQ